MQVKVKKLVKEAVVPKYAKAGDAGLDLTATSVKRERGKVIYGTGLAFEIPVGYVGLVFPRSSIHKSDLRLTNCVGVIDSGYRGEVMAVFDDKAYAPVRTDNGNQIAVLGQAFNVGDRIAQMIILPYPAVELLESEELSDTERGEGGFGSSGR
jgi:dUTP pyrophosphatase